MPRFRLQILLLCVVLSVPATFTQAAVKLHALFTEHAVLQRDMPIPVWGTASPGEQVRVTLGDATQSTQADQEGRWQVEMPARKAATGLTLSVQAGDDAATVVKDIAIGEVWLGSGQSNMAMTVRGAKDYEKEQAAATDSLIRVFTESSQAADQPQHDAKGAWKLCSPDSVGSFSATGYFFIRNIRRELDVPVGLIVSAVGGTPIEAWVRSEAQLADPQLKPSVQAAMAQYERFDPKAAAAQYERQLEKWKTAVAAARKSGQSPPRKPRDPNDTRRRKGNIGGLYNGKIAPLVPYAIRGVIWYQGEANSSSHAAPLYQEQLTALVTDWRKQWNRPDLPVAWVQLPNYLGAGRDWPTVRQEMLSALELPNTGMAITIDVGDPKDIHPKNKQAVGDRLAAWALADVYDRDGVASGPIPEAIRLQGGDAIVSFKHLGQGLRVRGDRLSGFEVRDAKGDWSDAKATIDGDTVRIHSDAVSAPSAARYLWENNPTQTPLENSAGLPASPFELVLP